MSFTLCLKRKLKVNSGKIKVMDLNATHTQTSFLTGLAKRVGARVLIASTSEVYGDPEVHPQTESYWGHVNPIGKYFVFLP